MSGFQSNDASDETFRTSSVFTATEFLTTSNRRNFLQTLLNYQNYQDKADDNDIIFQQLKVTVFRDVPTSNITGQSAVLTTCLTAYFALWRIVTNRKGSLR